MNYYISDMHFFHKNVTKEGNNFDNRPFNSLAEMHEYMKERWNRKVTNGDNVYILGDIAMRGTQEQLIALVSQLKGRKILSAEIPLSAGNGVQGILYLRNTNYWIKP